MKLMTICLLLTVLAWTATGCGKLTKRSGAEPTNTTEIEARGTVPEEEWDITMYDPEEVAKMRQEKAALAKAKEARANEAALPTVAAIPEETAPSPEFGSIAEPMASPDLEDAGRTTIPATSGTPVTTAPVTTAPAATAPAATTPAPTTMQETKATDLAYEEQADALQTTYISGYRVQLMATTDAEKAMEFAEAIQPAFSHSVYVEYQEPFYKVRLGDCQTREEAVRILSAVRANGFDEAWITETMVIQD
ncbi:MAG: SPOR domain-containing protein [Gemmatimonadetes bacterium]|nr:SPOR domain-containing protein [Gemmatimonadota bacterium]